MELIYAMALATIAGTSHATEIPTTGFDHSIGLQH